MVVCVTMAVLSEASGAPGDNKMHGNNKHHAMVHRHDITSDELTKNKMICLVSSTVAEQHLHAPFLLQEMMSSSEHCHQKRS